MIANSTHSPAVCLTGQCIKSGRHFNVETVKTSPTLNFWFGLNISVQFVAIESYWVNSENYDDCCCVSKFVHVICLLKLPAFSSRRIRVLIRVATSSSSLVVSGTANTRYQTSVPSTTCSRCSTTHYKTDLRVCSSSFFAVVVWWLLPILEIIDISMNNQ